MKVKEKLGYAFSLKSLFVLFCFLLIESSSYFGCAGSKFFSKSTFSANTHLGNSQDTEP